MSDVLDCRARVPDHPDSQRSRRLACRQMPEVQPSHPHRQLDTGENPCQPPCDQSRVTDTEDREGWTLWVTSNETQCRQVVPSVRSHGTGHHSFAEPGALVVSGELSQQRREVEWMAGMVVHGCPHRALDSDGTEGDVCRVPGESRVFGAGGVGERTVGCVGWG